MTGPSRDPSDRLWNGLKARRFNRFASLCLRDHGEIVRRGAAPCWRTAAPTTWFERARRQPVFICFVESHTSDVPYMEPIPVDTVEEARARARQMLAAHEAPIMAHLFCDQDKVETLMP